MGGDISFNNHSMKLAYGEDAGVLADKRVAAVQALSGTGACRLFADFQKRFMPESQVFIPVPTWSKYAFPSFLTHILSFHISLLPSLGISIDAVNLVG